MNLMTDLHCHAPSPLTQLYEHKKYKRYSYKSSKCDAGGGREEAGGSVDQYIDSLCAARFRI
jgi:hypothetical protein